MRKQADKLDQEEGERDEASSSKVEDGMPRLEALRCGEELGQHRGGRWERVNEQSVVWE